jgi:Flp pilus assembly protein TadD
MTRSTRRTLAFVVVVLAVAAAYANHWTNPFHFDDDHTVVQNPVIRDLSNLPRILTDARAASVLPTHAVYRPVTYVTLAIDYAIAGGLTPPVFHASTFVAFLLLLASVFVIARRTLDTAWPGPDNTWCALGAVALFGLHPACADTVNYVIQRAEVWSSLGTTASVAVYAARPAWRRYGLFVLPGVLGVFAKTTPASIFPLLIALYAWGVERQPRRERWMSVALAAAGSALAVTMCGRFTYATQTFDPGAPPLSQYLWTQPWVMLRYLRNFFLPIDLSIDPGWGPLATPTEPRALAGVTGLALVLTLTVWCLRRARTMPIGVGVAWFLIALVPVSVFPLAEVTNDHRMFLPFAGLALAAAGVARLVLGEAMTGRRVAVVSTCALIAGTAAAMGTWQRNRVWASHESVWADAVRKNPSHGRGHMNLGVALMARGAYSDAAREFEETVRLSPSYPLAYVNLAIVRDGMGQREDAQRHFETALQLAPQSSTVLVYYGRWLIAQGRYTEAVSHLEHALALAPDDVEARRQLMAGLEAHRAFGRLRAVAADTLTRIPGDEQARLALGRAEAALADLVTVRAALEKAPTANGWLDLSLRLYNEGDYTGSLDAARRVLQVQPNSAEAYNNIAAAHAALGQWAPAIEAARQALVLRPDFPLARNNLAWALSQQATSR